MYGMNGWNKEIPGGDLISRAAAIDALGEKPLAWMESEYAQGLQNQWVWDVNALKALPSAQPEIIRCKDCKKYDMHDHRCKHWNHGVVVMDWCSKAERR